MPVPACTSRWLPVDHRVGDGLGHLRPARPAPRRPGLAHRRGEHLAHGGGVGNGWSGSIGHPRTLAPGGDSPDRPRRRRSAVAGPVAGDRVRRRALHAARPEAGLPAVVAAREADHRPAAAPGPLPASTSRCWDRRPPAGSRCAGTPRRPRRRRPARSRAGPPAGGGTGDGDVAAEVGGLGGPGLPDGRGRAVRRGPRRRPRPRRPGRSRPRPAWSPPPPPAPRRPRRRRRLGAPSRGDHLRPTIFGTVGPGSGRASGVGCPHDQHPRGRGRRRDPRRGPRAASTSAASRSRRSATGLAGLEHVLREQPEVVLLDLGLPDVDGLTLISMIRAASDVPIIVITAQDDDPTHRAGARRRRRRLRGQAVRHRPGRRPHPGGAAPRRPDAGSRRAAPGRRAWSSTSATRTATLGRRAAGAVAQGVRPAARAGRPRRGRWSPSASCWPRCGSSRTAAPTAPSTCTCPGCAASSASPPPSRATCSASAGSGVRLVDPAPSRRRP